MSNWRGLDDLTRVAPGRRHGVKAPGTRNETGRDGVVADLRFRVSSPTVVPTPYPAAPMTPRTPDLGRYAPPASSDAQPRTTMPTPIAGAPAPVAPETPATPATPSVWLPMHPVDAAPVPSPSVWLPMHPVDAAPVPSPSVWLPMHPADAAPGPSPSVWLPMHPVDAAPGPSPSEWLPMHPVDGTNLPQGPVGVANGSEGVFAQPQPQPAGPEFWSGETPSTGGKDEKSPSPVALMRS